MPPASVDVTVVEETCLDPDDLRPLDDPAEQKRNIIKINDIWRLSESISSHFIKQDS